MCPGCGSQVKVGLLGVSLLSAGGAAAYAKRNPRKVASAAKGLKKLFFS